MTKKIAIISGEGAGIEVIDVTMDVLGTLRLPHEPTYPDIDGVPAEQLGDADAALFGAASARAVAMLQYLRWGKQTYANVRPVRWFRGMPSNLAAPEEVDLVIVRENLEDSYLGLEGPTVDLAPLQLVSATSGRRPETMNDGFYNIKIIARAATERVVRHAFELARSRRGRLTISAKSNILKQADGLFHDVAIGLAVEYPDVEYDYLLVDDCAHKLAKDPGRFDVLVMPNLYGDILSDLTAGLVGGLGCAPSACYGGDFAYFESVHGTAPDIAGQGIVNPTATMLSAAMMLDYLGNVGEAAQLRAAIEAVYAQGTYLTRDVGGTASTKEFGRAVIDGL